MVNLGRVKAPIIDDRKLLRIAKLAIDRFYGTFVAAQQPIFQVLWVYRSKKRPCSFKGSMAFFLDTIAEQEQKLLF